MKLNALFPKLAIILFLPICIISCRQRDKDAKEAVSDIVEYDSLLPIERLNLPEGFKISIFAKGVDEARSMAMGDDGTLFVGTRTANKLYAIQDLDGDFVADRTIVLDTTLETPNGIAYRDGALYVAEVNRLLRYPNIEQELENPPAPEVIFDDYPTEFHHF